jgi:hypothetical protein
MENQEQQGFASILLSGFFLILFVVACVLNMAQGDYVSAAGFVLLAISNIPPLLGTRLDQMTTPQVNTIANVIAFIGLALVFISWMGWT